MFTFSLHPLHPHRRLARACWTLALAWAVASAGPASACPFCGAASQTLSQELAGSDAAVIAELIASMPDPAFEDAPGSATDLDPLPGEESASDDAEPAAAPAATSLESFAASGPLTGSARFRIAEVLRGDDRLQAGDEIEVVYFGEDDGKQFLITGIADQQVDWTTPLPLSARAIQYVKQLDDLPEAGSERLKFFQQYFEDPDPLLAQDAYDEFARSPYADVIALGPEMDRQQLLHWIDSAQVGPSSRRLYLTMLGVCGQSADIPLLEEMLLYSYETIKPAVATTLAAAVAPSASAASPAFGLLDEVLHAEERRKKESLDALIACYLKLKGPEGLAIVNEHYLGNPDVEYKDLHSAIMALRFHGEETDVLPRELLLKSMRLALNHREFADQVIPDLTRWEDWSVMPRLVTMFKDSPENDWIRQPVASYLLVASEAEGDAGAEAEAALEELDRLDPETVKRARSLAAFSFLPRSNPGPAGGAAAPVADDGNMDADGEAIAANPPVPVADAESQSPSAAAETPAGASDASADAAVADAETAQGDDPASPAEGSPSLIADAPPSPSLVMIIGAPLLAGLVLALVFAVLLRGADPRSAERT